MTKVSWRARAREGAISILALATLLSILYVVDFRVRDGATHLFRATSGSNVTQLGSEVSSDAKLLLNARERGVEHAAMTAFVATAGVLLLFMLKT